MSGFAASIMFSVHLGLSGSFNAVHPALWWENEGWKTGAYYNSKEEVSFFVGHRIGNDIWFEGGVVTAYHFPAMVRGGVNLNDRASLWIAPVVSEFDEKGAVIGIEFRLY
jgi:hypothetical protein